MQNLEVIAQKMAELLQFLFALVDHSYFINSSRGNKYSTKSMKLRKIIVYYGV